MNLVYRNIFITSMVFLTMLVSCGGERCIDPDDFGFQSYSVSARYKDNELEGENENQVAPWRDFGLYTNGRPIVIVVKNWNYQNYRNHPSELSAWSGWFGTKDHENILSNIVEKTKECIFENDQMCTTGKEAKIVNAPCIFTKGVGLYGLISDPSSNPNASKLLKQNPNGIAFHLGEKNTGYNLTTINPDGQTEDAGGIIFNYNMAGLPGTQEALKQQYYKAPFYFKIIDRYYGDNSGQYKVLVKSGLDSLYSDPLGYLIDSVKGLLFGNNEQYGLVKQIYENVVNQNSFKVVVRALLILYIIFTAFSYVLGFIRMTQTEIIVRSLKVVLVSLLLTTEYSWQFFHDYLFVFFFHGVDYVTSIITGGMGSNLGKIPILQIMVSPQTYYKLFALLFMSFSAWVFIIFFFCLMYFVVLISIKAVIIYLTAILAIGIIVALGPIFICFMLFDITKSLFENWLRQLISYTLQPIILFAGLSFLSFMIMHEIYATLGFKVCKHKLFNFIPIQQIIGTYADELSLPYPALMYFWFPEPRDPGQISTDTKLIPVPYDHEDSNGNYCQAYECFEERIPDLPFLDPNDPRDQKRIDNFKSGKFIDFENLLILIIAVYLMHKFNELTVGIARILSQTSGNLSSIEQTASSSFDMAAGGLKRISSPYVKRFRDSVMSSPVAMPFRRAGSAVRSLFVSGYGKYYASKQDSLMREAVTSGKALESVIKEAEKATGLKYKDLNLKEYANYQNTLKDMFKANGIKNLSSSELTSMSLDDMKNILANKKFNKDFANLRSNEMKELESIIEGAEKKLGREFSTIKASIADVEKFQKSYVEIHNKMSKEGIGALGKRFKGLRTIEKIRNSMKHKR